MALTRQEVAHIADLAKLSLTESEVEHFREQLSAILDYMTMLQRIDTEHVAPTAQVSGISNAARPDVVRPALPVEDVLANAPARKDGYFCVPPVLEEAP